MATKAAPKKMTLAELRAAQAELAAQEAMLIALDAVEKASDPEEIVTLEVQTEFDFEDHRFSSIRASVTKNADGTLEYSAKGWAQKLGKSGEPMGNANPYLRYLPDEVGQAVFDKYGIPSRGTAGQ